VRQPVVIMGTLDLPMALPDESASRLPPTGNRSYFY